MFVLFVVTQLLVKKSLKLLEELPVLRDAVFDYYSLIFEVSIGNYIKIEVSLILFIIEREDPIL